MNVTEFRAKIIQYNNENPSLSQCICPNCLNKIYITWDNTVLCHEHQLLMEYWFYEKSGYRYCPDIWDMNGKKLPKPKGSDKNMELYRQRYCDWIASLSQNKYIKILKHQIGDHEDD